MERYNFKSIEEKWQQHWEDKKTFDLYNDNFIKSIQDITLSIENEDSISLMENFNIMASNCGTCHKKFRN